MNSTEICRVCGEPVSLHDSAIQFENCRPAHESCLLVEPPKVKVWIVRVIACGSVIAGCLEDGFGKPLTRRTAQSLADFENQRSERRRAAGMPQGCFDYVIDSFYRSQPTTTKET